MLDPAIDPLRLTPGTAVGRYEILRPIGSGASGVVYEAVDPSLGRRVALKVLRIGACEPDRAELASARFRREGRAAAQVRHAHIVHIFDFGVDRGTPYLVMELVDGETLAQRLQRQNKIPLDKLIEIALPILSATAELHAAGIVHRDIKPANILLPRGRDVDPRLADFGVSRLEDGSPAITQSGAVIGTPEYMAPELIRTAQAATELSDQYALGVLLYECATGEKPFRGQTTYELMHAAVRGEALPPSSVEPSLPKGFDAAVLRAMHREANGRFASVDELAEALLPFASSAVAARWRSEFVPRSERVLAEPDEVLPAFVRTPRSSREARAQRWLVALAVGVGVAAAAAVAGLAFRSSVAQSAAADAPAVSALAQVATREEGRVTPAAPVTSIASEALSAPVGAPAATPAGSPPPTPPARVVRPAASHAVGPRRLSVEGLPPRDPPRSAAASAPSPWGRDNEAPILDVP